MPVWLIPALLGLAFGTVIAGFNHFLLMRTIRKTEAADPAKAKNAVLISYMVRMVIDVVALLLVYRSIPMLIGTAIGLTMSKNMLFVTNLWSRKKENSKKER